ncbi:uncharacterized protein RSE6_06871 [Rhynchosporium secalis]|uniref:Uncharacterized protein n=1 Tax=Rhynchosporium secalis TaxID=38038 RepID=A0A1E1MCG6_RHYSE|nr:uncharacterized protein RSE6_06871 [Rhynchosporium secalis]
MAFRILLSLKESHDLSAFRNSERFDNVDKVTQDLSMSLIADRALFKDALRFQTGTITRVHQDVKDHITGQHDQTRTAIFDAFRTSHSTQHRSSGTRRAGPAFQESESEANMRLVKAQDELQTSLKFQQRMNGLTLLQKRTERLWVGYLRAESRKMFNGVHSQIG